jgi:hypothetical protein
MWWDKMGLTVMAKRAILAEMAFMLKEKGGDRLKGEARNRGKSF